jgi:hypothetical protein
MSDIFISYAREDRSRAETIAKALEDYGWSVWWDRDIRAGKNIAVVIEEQIDQARCLVVLWSATSIRRDWVNDEAREGNERGILVPVLIENVRPPLGLRSMHAADLTGWDRDTIAPAFLRLRSDIEALIGAPREVAPVPSGSSTSPSITQKVLVPKPEHHFVTMLKMTLAWSFVLRWTIGGSLLAALLACIVYLIPKALVQKAPIQTVTTEPVSPRERPRSPAMASFRTFIEQFFPETHHMYLDTRQLVCIGSGALIDPVEAAQELPFQWKNKSGIAKPGQRATKQEIADEWHRLKNRQSLTQTNLELTDDAINVLMEKAVDRYISFLKRQRFFEHFDEWPADAQLGLLSMAWAMGPGGPGGLLNFRAACEKMDFAAAADECRMNEAGNPPELVSLNRANRILLWNQFSGSFAARIPHLLFANVQNHAWTRTAQLGHTINIPSGPS